MMTNQREFKGRHLAIMMVCFFGVIVTVNFSMAYIARTNWTGLVVKNSYVASQHFNEELEAAQRQKAAGWVSDFAYDQGTLYISLKDADAKPLLAKNVRAQIGRPAFEKLDHEVQLRAQGSGQFKIYNPLEAGLWKIVLVADVDGEPYRRDLRLLITDSGEGLIQ